MIHTNYIKWLWESTATDWAAAMWVFLEAGISPRRDGCECGTYTCTCKGLSVNSFVVGGSPKSFQHIQLLEGKRRDSRAKVNAQILYQSCRLWEWNHTKPVSTISGSIHHQPIPETVDGKSTRKPCNWWLKARVSCRFDQQPTQWTNRQPWIMRHHLWTTPWCQPVQPRIRSAVGIPYVGRFTRAC